MEGTGGPQNNLAQFYLALLDAEDDDGAPEAGAEAEAAAEAAVATVRPENFSAAAREKWLAGRAALTITPLKIPAEDFFARLLTVARACRESQSGPQLAPEDVLTALTALSPAQRRELCAAAAGAAAFAEGFPPAEKRRWAAKFGLLPEMLDFLLFHTLRPFLRRYGRALAKELDFDEWGRGSCPICGGPPALARITAGEGVRRLYCLRCESQWRYRRIGCPFCGNEDAGSLSFLEVEGHAQYRLYLCEACRRYLKTVDERKTQSETDLFCADLATAWLDQLAAGEGYRRAKVF